jgi:arylsulfatase A-like enzyme
VPRCKATDKDDATEDPAFGRVGRQVIENTGPLDTKRMQTIDEEFIAAALDFMDRRAKEGKPWFCYVNTTRMHIWTHLKPASAGKTGLGVYPDGMVELDGYVGQLLDKVDKLQLADNTIVVFTTDNGAEVMSWPDGGCTPFRGEKDTNWEGGWRVPCVMRWPGVIKPGTVINDQASLQDFIPTFAAANGDPDLVEKVRKGHAMGGRSYKVHLDGVNLLPFLKGDVKESPREGFLYWSDDGELIAVRVNKLEDLLRGAAPRRDRRVARAVLEDADPQALQPALGSVRARPRVAAVREMVRRPRLRARAGAGAGRAVARELQGVPAAGEGGELQHRPDRREPKAEGLTPPAPLKVCAIAIGFACGIPRVPRNDCFR